MAETEIKVPDFKYTGMYYPQVLRTMRQYRRVYVPEITSEDDHEPFEQLLRAYSLASHISNVLADMVALESFLPTAKLLSSVRNHLALIGYKLLQAIPSEVEALIELSKVFSTETMIIGPPQQHMTQFGTEQTEVDNEIIFEYVDVDEDGYFVARTDKFGGCFAEERTDPFDPLTATFTDYTTEINEVGTSSFVPWTTPNKNDALYFGHVDIMSNRLDINIATGSSGIQGVWEYYDGDYKDSNPDAVENLGPNLKLTVNSLLGQLDRSGTIIRAIYLPTGSYEDIYSEFDGTDNYVELTGLLGQITTPSTNVDDYSVGSLWSPLPDVADETNELQQSGRLTFSLPQTTSLNWQQSEVNGSTQYWLRYRIVKVTSPAAPSIESAKLDQGKQYLIIPLVQGKTVSDEPLGSSNGLANQVFRLKQSPMIDGTLIVEVGGSIWNEVDNFLVSGSQDLHYTVDFDDEGYTTITFGDGIRGAIPAMGINNIAAYYRIGGNQDGNVPAGSLTANTSGLAYVATVTNPRPGNGWKVNEGGDDADMARVKIAGPASLRTLERAINPGDLESLATAYRAADNSKPVARAFAVEESYGPKTMEAVCVGQGGNFLTDAQIAEFSVYLNGDKTSSPPKRGAILANTQATVVNYSRRIVNVTATVYGGNRTEIENALAALLAPLKLKDDGVSYQWGFGGEVPLSVIIDAIHNVSTSIRKVVLSVPTADTALRMRELPWPGTLSITVMP
jgi:hypothetical protein